MHLIPADEMSLRDKEMKREAAGMAIMQRIADLTSKPVTKVSYRPGDPALDFGCTGRSWWLTANLAVVQTRYSLFTTLAAPAVGVVPQVPNNRLIVAYGVDIKTSPNPVSQLLLLNGPTVIVGNLRAVYDMEILEPYDHWVGYFSEPQVWDPQDWVNVCVLTKAAPGIQWPIELLTFVSEPVNLVVTA